MLSCIAGCVIQKQLLRGSLGLKMFIWEQHPREDEGKAGLGRGSCPTGMQACQGLGSPAWEFWNKRGPSECPLLGPSGLDIYMHTSPGRISLAALMVKNLSAMQETWVRSMGWEHPLEKGLAAHSSFLAWRIPWTEEPGGPQSMGSQIVRQDWETKTHLAMRSPGHQVWAVLEGAWRLLGPLSAVEAHPEEGDSSRPPCSLQCPQLGSKPFFEEASRHHFVHQVLCLNKIGQSEICYFGILWSHQSENTLSVSYTLLDKSMVGCESTRWWLPEAMACWDGDRCAAVCEGVFSGFIAPAKRQKD